MIFERWITAADTLGAFWSGFASYTVNDVADVLGLCRESALADQLRNDGPPALCRLDMERRSELAAKVEPTLGAGLKRILQSEAVEMERSLGSAVPLRLIVFGRSAGSEFIGPVMNREFPHQRGTALFLERPSAKHLATFENWRHQMLWPEPNAPIRRGEMKNLRRLRLFRNPNDPSNIMSLDNLVRLRPTGLFHSSCASKPFVTFHPGEIVRFGGLSLETLGDGDSPARTAEVLLVSGAIVSGFANKDGLVRIFLGPPRETYGRIDFDPLEHKAQLSVLRTRDHGVISQTTSEVRKDRTILRNLIGRREEVLQEIEDAILMDLEESARTINRQRAAHAQAGFTVDTAIPYAGRYLEWLEWHPEAAVTECQAKLANLEAAMMEDITPELRNVTPALLRRDLYRAFEQFLLGWGLGQAP